MAQHSAVGIYSTLGEAEAAVRSLGGGGIPIALIGGCEVGAAGPLTAVAGWLFNLGLTTEQVLKYQEAIKSGKFLVLAHGTEGTVKKAHDILAGSKAVKLDLNVSATV